MVSSAFIPATPLSASPRFMLTSSFTTSSVRQTVVSTPFRRSTIMALKDPESSKIPQGFTAFSEQLNGRAAMMGFLLAIVTEAITGKGIIGQVSSIFDIVNGSFAFGN